MKSNEWEQAISQQIGRAIDRAKGDRSDQWIADRTKELGHALSRTAVSEYRRGVRKSTPVSDLMILAAALEVPPVTLIYPDLATTPTEALPGEILPTIEALQWFTGERGKPLQRKEMVLSKVPITKFHTEDSREFKLLAASRKLAEEILKSSGLLRLIRQILEMGKDADDFEELQEKYDASITEQRLEERMDDVRELGGHAELTPEEVSYLGDH